MDSYQQHAEMYGRPQITPHQHTSQYPYTLPPQHSLSYVSESSGSEWATPGASFFATDSSGTDYSEPSSVGSLSQSGPGQASSSSTFDPKFQQQQQQHGAFGQLDPALRSYGSSFDRLSLSQQAYVIADNDAIQPSQQRHQLQMHQLQQLQQLHLQQQEQTRQLKHHQQQQSQSQGASPQAFDGYTEQQQQFQAMMAQQSLLESEIRPRNNSTTAFGTPPLDRYRDEDSPQGSRRNSVFTPFPPDPGGNIGMMGPPMRPSQRHQFSVEMPPPPRIINGPPSPTLLSASQVYGAYGSSYIATNGQPPSTLAPPSPASFSMNPTAPSDPFDAAALGLPVPNQSSTNWTGAYSSTGFDMVSILAKVASRPNAQLSLGPIDLSCSFVVVDAKKWDQPIVFASDTFSRLTGYSNAEIIGRNCRFLQAPDGVTVRQGEKRKYTDGNAAYHLRRHLILGQESQASLINYCKGGKPFINLVTIIPISWGASEDIAYYVGFQVDLVEQPAAIVEKARDGSYVVNYSLSASSIPQAIDSANVEPFGEVHQISSIDAKDPTVEIVETITTKGVVGLTSEPSRKQFNKMLLEHCDDFVHVLSLKGSLLYVSPSVKRLLEYDPTELVGKGLSTICHPSDIVSVLRELKEATASQPISIVYRVRRKTSGYMWLEATGRLHLEQGKGRKCVILVGRPREVYRMSWSDLERQGGFGATEFWSKLSAHGMFLYSTPTVSNILNMTSEEMTGRTLADLSPNGDATAVRKALNQALQGLQSTVRHNMLARNGMVDVVTHFYPAKSDTDLPPTSPSIFASATSSTVIAQTNLFSSEVTKGRNVSLPSAPSSRAAMESAQNVAPVAFTLPSFGRTGSGSGSDSDGSNGNGGKTSFSAIPSTFKTLSHDNASDNVFDELDSVRGTSWQFELHQMRLTNKKLREEKAALLALQRNKKRKRTDSNDRLSASNASSPVAPSVRRCANCGRSQSAEWRTGPTGPKTLCNACGLRWSKARPSAQSSSSQTALSHHGSTTSESLGSGSSRGASRTDSSTPSE
ncbi:hypothetical protein OIO90_002034 [Microbotryomycetes sp. JL221]|nr:hypothetical protein OIO90_002034 [Microbotryomycetes sp. JL221]